MNNMYIVIAVLVIVVLVVLSVTMGTMKENFRNDLLYKRMDELMADYTYKYVNTDDANNRAKVLRESMPGPCGAYVSLDQLGIKYP